MKNIFLFYLLLIHLVSFSQSGDTIKSRPVVTINLARKASLDWKRKGIESYIDNLNCRIKDVL